MPSGKILWKGRGKKSVYGDDEIKFDMNREERQEINCKVINTRLGNIEHSSIEVGIPVLKNLH